MTTRPIMINLSLFLSCLYKQQQLHNKPSFVRIATQHILLICKLSLNFLTIFLSPNNSPWYLIKLKSTTYLHLIYSCCVNINTKGLSTVCNKSHCMCADCTDTHFPCIYKQSEFTFDYQLFNAICQSNILPKRINKHSLYKNLVYQIGG